MRLNLPEWITFQEAAKVSGLSIKTIKKWVKTKKLFGRYPKQNRGEVQTISLLKTRFPGVVSEAEFALAIESQNA